MRNVPILAALAGILATGFAAGSARAEPTVPFERVAGWEVARAQNYCVMARGRADAVAGTPQGTVLFTLAPGGVVVSLMDRRWAWQAADAKVIPLLVDGAVVADGPSWKADGQVIAGKFQEEIVPALAKATRFGVRLPDGDVEFDVAGFPEGYASLQRCEAARAVPIPPAVEIKAYLIGKMFEATMRDCDAGTSAEDLAAVRGKLAAMRPRMVPLEAPISDKVANRAERCTGDVGTQEYKDLAGQFVAKSPAEFVAEVDRRTAAEKAGSGAAPKP